MRAFPPPLSRQEESVGEGYSDMQGLSLFLLPCQRLAVRASL